MRGSHQTHGIAQLNVEGMDELFDLVLVIEQCSEKPGSFKRGQPPLGENYIEKLQHIHVLKSPLAQYYHCLDLHMCPHYQVGKNEYPQLVPDAARLDVPFSAYSSTKTNRHQCNGFLHVVNHGTKDYNEFFGTDEEVMADVCVAVEMVLEQYGATKKHRRREKDINTELLSMETGEKGSGDFDG